MADAGGGDFLSWTFSDVDIDQSAMNAARTYRSESMERREEKLEEFIQLILEDESLQQYLNVHFLMRFLRGAKFNCGRAHKRLRRYYSTKYKHPEIFKDFLPRFTLQAQSLNFISVLPFRSKDNSLIIIYRVGKFDATVATFEECLRLQCLVLESLLQNPVTQLCGVTLIIDFSDFSIQQTTQITPGRMETVFEIYHSSNSLRIMNIHIINAPFLVNSIFELVQDRIMSQIIKNRVFSHSCGASLQLHFPPEILPEEFSGYLKPSELICVNDLLNCNEDYFVEQLLFTN